MNDVCLQFYKKLSNSLENVVWTNNEVKKAGKWCIMNVWVFWDKLTFFIYELFFFADPALLL